MPESYPSINRHIAGLPTSRVLTNSPVERYPLRRKIGIMVEKLASQTAIVLPPVNSHALSLVSQLMAALSVPRDVLASDENIALAWSQLPALLSKIPPALRDQFLARMCVAIAVGLTDSAINYAWNSAVTELRNKIRRFGLNVVSQITGKSFDEKALISLQDSALLSLCLEINLLTEDGFFMLDQCREIRNSYSAAHPTIGQVDGYELINFVNRCAKYALADDANPKGVETKAFISSVKGDRFNELQQQTWVSRINATHEAQRAALILTLHGIYCDPSVPEQGRQNAFSIAEAFQGNFTPQVQSELIERHYSYGQQGDDARRKASLLFLQRLNMLQMLDDTDRHLLISNAAKRLMQVHQSWNNFFNEPPFAARLGEIAEQIAIPSTAKAEYVGTVIACYIGNPYGTSDAAEPAYEKMIRGFTPDEIAIFLDLTKTNETVKYRVTKHTRCWQMFKKAVGLLDANSVPTSCKNLYDGWMTAK